MGQFINDVCITINLLTVWITAQENIVSFSECEMLKHF